MSAVKFTAALCQGVQDRGKQAGFDAVGIASVGVPEDAFSQEASGRFVAWVEAGRAGEMGYLKRRDVNGSLLRSNIRLVMPWARSVIVCALNYNAALSRSIDPSPSGAGWIARYAWSGTKIGGEMIPTDYHEELIARLRIVEQSVRAMAECETRCYVDTGPIVERDLAAKAGVGWIGKNTCVMNQQLGSWLLLGVVVTSLPLEEDALPALSADRCGSCTRCIDACPTGALVAPREMDASLCIAYLTIEKKGAIPVELRGKMGRQVFGCDICQDVCPWNRRAPASGNERMEPREELVNPALEWLGCMDAGSFRRWFGGSPVERTGRKRLLRNVCIAMGNSGESRFLDQLEEWRSGEDVVLAETAEWGIRQIHRTGSDETPAVRAERVESTDVPAA